MRQDKTSRFLVLGLCLLMFVLHAAAYAEAMLAELPLAEPVVQADAGLSTGQVTKWCCITFGEYPQTEIVPSDFSAVDEYAVQEGDVLVDPKLYLRLLNASWTENETKIDGNRYLRMSRREAVNSAMDSAGHYRWGR